MNTTYTTTNKVELEKMQEMSDNWTIVTTYSEQVGREVKPAEFVGMVDGMAEFEF